jgi:hypothetical protein
MGLIAEAHEAWRGLMRVTRNFSIEHRRKVLPYQNPNDFESKACASSGCQTPREIELNRPECS